MNEKSPDHSETDAPPESAVSGSAPGPDDSGLAVPTSQVDPAAVATPPTRTTDDGDPIHVDPSSGVTSTFVREQRTRRETWKTRLKRIGSILLLILGVSAIGFLVFESGSEDLDGMARFESGLNAVWTVIAEAGIWLPLIIVLEALWISQDVFVVRVLLGEHRRKIPIRAYIRSAMLAYGVMIVLPAGRAGAEATRAAILARHVGGPRAIAAATQVQAFALLGNTIISLPCFVFVGLAKGFGHELALLILANGVLTAVIALGLIYAPRGMGIGGWIGRKFKAMATHGANFDDVLKQMPPVPPMALVHSGMGRLFQTLQYGIILLAVGGVLSVDTAFISEGIHLVGAGVGDMVPNAVGITEGAYRVFADALGLSDDTAKAISIALIARLCQYALVIICIVTTTVWRGPAKTYRATHGDTEEITAIVKIQPDPRPVRGHKPVRQAPIKRDL